MMKNLINSTLRMNPTQLVANEWRYRFLVVTVVLLYLALAFGSSLTKRPWIDEAYQANCSLDVLVRGTAGLSMLEPSGFINRPGQYFSGINHFNFLWMPIPYYVFAAWYKLFGFSLISTRLISATCGLILVLACRTIVWQLTGNRMLALLAMFLVAVDREVIDAGSDGRPDMLAAALCFAGLAVYLYLRTKSLDRAVFAGHCLIAAGVFSHPVAMNGFFGGIFLALYLDRSRLRWKHLFLAGLPYVLALGGWGLFILRDRADFWPQFSANLRSRGSGFFAPWRSVWDEISKRYVSFYLPPYAYGVNRLRILIPLVYFFAALAGWFVPSLRRLPGRRALLSLAVLYFAIMTFAEGLKSSYYLIHAIPMFACTLAIWVDWCWSRGALLRWSAITMTAAVALLQIGWTAALVRRNDYLNAYVPVIAFLRVQAPKPVVVMGTTELGFALGFYGNVIEDSALGYYTKKRGAYIVVDDRTLGQAMQAYKTYAPWLYSYEQDLLAREYRVVYNRRPYTIYAHMR
jgi:hypothetical protein